MQLLLLYTYGSDTGTPVWTFIHSSCAGWQKTGWSRMKMASAHVYLTDSTWLHLNKGPLYEQPRLRGCLKKSLQKCTGGGLEGLNGRWMSSHNMHLSGFFFFFFFLSLIFFFAVQYPLLSLLELSLSTTLYHILENNVLNYTIRTTYYCFLRL